MILPGQSLPAFSDKTKVILNASGRTLVVVMENNDLIK